MTKKEFTKIYETLENTEKDISCTVSSNLHQGQGVIIDAEWATGVFAIKMESGEEITVPYFGVMV